MCNEHNRKTWVSIFYKSLSETSPVVTIYIIRRSTFPYFILCQHPLSTSTPSLQPWHGHLNPSLELVCSPHSLGMQLSSRFCPIFLYLFAFEFSWLLNSTTPLTNGFQFLTVNFLLKCSLHYIVIIITPTCSFIHGIVFIYFSFLLHITHFDLRRPQW
jgi:hypothetical protein